MGYVLRHWSSLRAKSASSQELLRSALSLKEGLTDTYRKVRQLSGAGDSNAYLDMQQARMEKIGIPSLLINSRDDPICVWENVTAYAERIAANQNLVLAELQRGAHGCKYDFWGVRSVGHDMIGEFVTASWQELAKEKDMHACALGA